MSPRRIVLPASGRNGTSALLCLLCVSWLITLPARSATDDVAATDFGQYFTDTLGGDVGLPQTAILAVRQLHDGSLWIGTEGGLARFDGVRFVSFRPLNTPAFISHFVYCLFEDRAGALWIGTERGLVRYREGKFEHMGLADVGVRTITQDRSGQIWIGTTGRGLFAWRDDHLR